MDEVLFLFILKVFAAVELFLSSQASHLHVFPPSESFISSLHKVC